MHWQKLILATLLFIFPTISNHARTPNTYFYKTHSFNVPYEVQSLAISADESLIAVSMNIDSSESIIQIYDRQSTKPLAQIQSKEYQIQEIKFDNYSWKLASINQNSIKVWNLSQIPNLPGKPLPSKYLELEIKKGTPNHSTKFNKKQSTLNWIENFTVKKQTLNSNSANNGSIWKEPTEKTIEHFALDQNDKWLAYNIMKGNRIALANTQNKLIKPELDYHNFPITQLEFISPNRILSLDTERNLIWGNLNNRIKTYSVFIRDIPANENTIDFKLIFKDDFISILTQNSSTSKISSYFINKKGDVFHTFPLTTSKSLTISPTGAYILASSSPQQVDVHQFRFHQKPSDYIKFLIDNGAPEVARRYQNHLETLPQEIVQNYQKNINLQILIDSLNAAISADQWGEVEEWVEKILKRDPKNKSALEAKTLLTDHQDLIKIHKGKKEIENHQYKQSIKTLAQIPKASSYRTEARQLIKVSETEIQTALHLKEAKKELLVKNWQTAKALLLPLLGKDPTNTEALALLEEVEDQQMSSLFLKIIVAIVILGAFAGIGFILVRHRKGIFNWFSLKEQSPLPLKPPTRRKNSGNKPSTDTHEKQYFLETLEKAKTILSLSKDADKIGMYTNLFFDLEAEIKIIQRKSNQPEVNYKQLHKQLLHILQNLRGLKFEKPSKKKKRTESDSAKRSQSFLSRKQKPQKENYYTILNISQTASLKDIKEAYHQKMKSYHPDLHQNADHEWIKKEAESRTRLIQEAYDTLKNQQSRQQYDKSINPLE